MNCPYCSKEIYRNKSIMYDCKSCHADFVIAVHNERIIMVNIYYENYRVSFWPNLQVCDIAKSPKYKDWFQLKNGEHPLPYETILSFEKTMPNITPSNIASKLKTILTFS